MKKKLLLFDIDGTLVSVQPTLLDTIFSRLVSEVINQDLGDFKLELHGKTDRQIFIEICQVAGLSIFEIVDALPKLESLLLQEWKTKLNQKTVELKPKVVELIHELSENKNVTLGLVTGNLQEAAFIKLKPYNLHKYFSFGGFGSDSVIRNNLPNIALERANRLSENIFTNLDAIIIGDSHRDIECAKVSNMRCLSVATGGLSVEELEKHNTDLAVSDFNDSRVLEFLLG